LGLLANSKESYVISLAVAIIAIFGFFGGSFGN
jgi:hypothetical protein